MTTSREPGYRWRGGISLVLPVVLVVVVAVAVVAPAHAAARNAPGTSYGYDSLPFSYDGSIEAVLTQGPQNIGRAALNNRDLAQRPGSVYELLGCSYATNAIDDVGAAGTRATVHGSERLSQAGFTDELVAQTKSALSTTQADGAAVYVREVSPGRFDFIVEGERGVITAHRGWSQKAIDRLAANYGWEGWPP